MPLLTITTPEVESRIRVQDTEDNLIFEDDVVYIDHILSTCQTDVDLEEDDAIQRWLPAFTNRLNEHYSVSVTATTAFYIAREAARLMWVIKKKYDSTLTLQESME
tara:strand:+ start:926 stop:1243 length:318 start_codon:yes stop_codon:yes gene_type:complete